MFLLCMLLDACMSTLANALLDCPRPAQQAQFDATAHPATLACFAAPFTACCIAALMHDPDYM